MISSLVGLRTGKIGRVEPGSTVRLLDVAVVCVAGKGCGVEEEEVKGAPASGRGDR